MENNEKTTDDETTKDACTTPSEQATQIKQEHGNTQNLSENDSCDEVKRVVLIIGKTGNGKSSMGNTLLGKEEFTVGRGMASITTETKQSVFLEVPGIKYKLQVIDTPDLSNLEMEDNINTDSTVKQWKDMTSSFLFVIVLAVRCDVRYTAEEYDVYREVKKQWGDDSAFCNHLVVGFTFGDRLDGKIKQELEGVCGDLKSVLKDAGGRYVVFDNTASDEEKLEQRKDLMGKGEGIWKLSAYTETDKGFKQLMKVPSALGGRLKFVISKVFTKNTTEEKQTKPMETGDTTELGGGANGQNVQANTSDHGTNKWLSNVTPGYTQTQWGRLKNAISKVFTKNTTEEKQTKPMETRDTTERGGGANEQNVQANTSDRLTSLSGPKITTQSTTEDGRANKAE